MLFSKLGFKQLQAADKVSMIIRERKLHGLMGGKCSKENLQSIDEWSGIFLVSQDHFIKGRE